MNKMRTIAAFGGWEVVQDLNGCISIHFESGAWICGDSAYEAIRDEVKDPAIRAELLKQWEADCAQVKRAEEMTPVVEAALGGKAETKDLVEEIAKGAL